MSDQYGIREDSGAILMGTSNYPSPMDYDAAKELLEILKQDKNKRNYKLVNVTKLRLNNE